MDLTMFRLRLTQAATESGIVVFVTNHHGGIVMHNNRLKNILAAGAVTGILLATFIAFAWRDLGQADAAAMGSQSVTETAPSAAQDSSALQAENQQLRDVLATMQEREQQYQAQLEMANQTILQLQAGTGNVTGNSAALTFGEREHEEHEFGEFGDD
jgi:hypothetical protein